MYGVVLLVAMSGGAQAPDQYPVAGCYGCGGCYGGWSGCSGCYGGCHGMRSHGGHGCRGGMFHRRASHGCSGCYGGYGCYGGVSYGCSGYYGCYGGGVSYGCYGGGVTYGCYGGGVSYGCYGGGVTYGCYGGGVIYGCQGGMPYPPPMMGKTLEDKGGKMLEDKGGKRIEDKGIEDKGGKGIEDKDGKKIEDKDIGTSAMLIIHVPADARLTIGSQPTEQTGERRSFVTPALEPGKVYTYPVAAEVIRNGQPSRWQEKVTVRAGQATEITLTPPAAGVAAR